MKFSAFIHFFLFTLLVSLGIVILTSIFGLVRGSFVPKDLLIGFVSMLVFSILFSSFGGIWAKQTAIETKNNNEIAYITKQIDLLKENKKFIIEENGNSIIISSTKYYEWFYGKTIINIQSSSIKISGAKCVINKYFSYKNRESMQTV